ncbi:hypothetical protein, partial [Anoxynatronum sibiricum]
VLVGLGYFYYTTYRGFSICFSRMFISDFQGFFAFPWVGKLSNILECEMPDPRKEVVSIDELHAKEHRLISLTL